MVGKAAVEQVRVLLVEDERSIVEPFANALTREGFEPTIAPTAACARSELATGEHDIVILDLALPDGDGRDIARELRASSGVPIIIVTARGSEVDRVVGLELGADDYVVKPFSAAEVIARIRAVLRRSAPDRGGAALLVGQLRLDTGARRCWHRGEELALTRKEFDLLARLMASAGMVVGREDLMNDVWDVNWFGSTKTLDVHIAALRRKLGEDAWEARLIHTVRGVGFRFATEQELRP